MSILEGAGQRLEGRSEAERGTAVGRRVEGALEKCGGDWCSAGLWEKAAMLRSSLVGLLGGRRREVVDWLGDVVVVSEERRW